MRRCEDCGDFLTELDFGLRCLECNAERFFTLSRGVEQQDPMIYFVPIRPDPRQWKVFADIETD
ncbi:MAG: hypothetical protein ACE5Q6_24670 [Dehalococcoidia bacterium]